MMGSPPFFFPDMDSQHLVHHLSIAGQSGLIYCVLNTLCVFPNSWAGPTEPKHHGWLLITHPNNPYIT